MAKKDEHLIQLTITANNLLSGDAQKADKDVRALGETLDKINKDNNRASKQQIADLEKQIKTVQALGRAEEDRLLGSLKVGNQINDIDKQKLINKEKIEAAEKRIIELEKEGKNGTAASLELHIAKWKAQNRGLALAKERLTIERRVENEIKKASNASLKAINEEATARRKAAEKARAERDADVKQRLKEIDTIFNAQVSAYKWLEQEGNRQHIARERRNKAQLKYYADLDAQTRKLRAAQIAAIKEELKGDDEKSRKRKELYDLMVKQARLEFNSRGGTSDALESDANLSKMQRLRGEINLLGGDYADLESDVVRSELKMQAATEAHTDALTENVKQTRRIEREANKVTAARNAEAKATRTSTKETEKNNKTNLNLLSRWKQVARTGGELSRKLGRLGLAIRGLAIVGVLAFMRALVATISALIGTVVALAGSLVYAAGALGGTFVAAAAQALPVIGLLIASFQRLAAIQEAVAQSDLLKKQQFGDTGAEDTAIDNTNQIADANDALREAQEGVTEARKEARKELQELIYKEREAELALRGSILSQADAQRALREAIREGDTEGIAQAQLDIDQTRFDTGQSRRNLREIRQERRLGNRRGVNGDPQVVDAIKAVADAQRNLADAHKTAATAAIEQSSAESSLAYFLSQLSDAERKLYKQFQAFRTKFAKVTRPITDILITSFSKGFAEVQKLIFNPKILGGFETLAIVLGDSIERIAGFLSGPFFTKFFEETLSEAAGNLPTITSAFITLAKIFANIATASAPVLHELLKLILGELKQFEEVTGRENSTTAFFERGLDHLRAWGSLIKAIIGLFGELMGASSDSQLGLLGTLTETINGAKEALALDDSGAVAFFEDAAQSMRYLGGVVVELGKAFVELSGSKHVKALADIFTKLLIPGLKDGIKFVGGIAIVIDKLLDIPLVAEFLQWGVAIAVISASIGSLYAIFKPMAVLFKNFYQVMGKLFKLEWVANLKGISGLRVELTWLKAIFSSKGLIGGIRLLTKGLAGIPVVGWIVAAVIEVIIGAITGLIENFGGIRDFIADQFGAVGDVFKDLGVSVGDLFGELGTGGKGLDGLKEMLGVLWDIVGAVFKVIGFFGKLIGTLAIGTIVNMIVTPLQLIVGALTQVIKFLTKTIKLFKKLFTGDISFKDFTTEMGHALTSLITGLLGVVGGVIGRIFKGLGNIVYAGFKEALGAIFGEKLGSDIINTVVDIVNWVIDRINEISPFGDIDKLDRPDALGTSDEAAGNSSLSASSRMTTAERRNLNRENRNGEKEIPSKKKPTKEELGFAKALKQTGGLTQKNLKLSNKMAGALERTSKAHRRARNFQEALRAETNKATNAQTRYLQSVRGSARAEERLGEALKASKRARFDSTAIDMLASEKRQQLRSATRGVTSSQENLTDATKLGNRFQKAFNKTIAVGTGNQTIYGRMVKNATSETKLESVAIRTLGKRMNGLNAVLKTTAENSRSLGVVFKSVTNKILTEFNVKPIKVELPEVAGMFKETGLQNFASGGYFGRKGERKPDDRMVKVGGGEAFLTGAQQREADRAFAVSHAVGASRYNSLDSLFLGENRAHAGTGYQANTEGFARGGRNSNRSANAGGRSIIIPRSVPDADGALPGLDLVGWLANKYFGLSVTDGIRSAGTLTSSGNISDHTWGGAIDISNGSNPTPQMDAAWQWFADVLGTGGSWQESYAGGAIKQMLYRTNIGGNHFNHIHIALQEQYARDIEALTKILTGKAIPVAGGGSIFTEVPKIKIPKIKGDKGAPKQMLQGQAKRLTNAANKHLGNNITAASGGIANMNLENISAYKGKLNKQFPEGSGIQIAPWQAAMLAEKAGMPGVTMAQVAKGESDFRPGAVGDDAAAGYGNTFGLGLWQMTTGVGNDELIAKYGGRNAMFNPWLNALAASELYKNAGGISPWYGTSYVTGDNLHWDGHKDIGLSRGGKLPAFDDGGIVPGRIGEPRMILAHGGEEVIPSHDNRKLEAYAKKSKPKKSKVSAATKQIRNIRQKISNTQDRIEDTENKSIIRRLRDRLDRFKDDILEVRARDEFTEEIKKKNKQIRAKEKELDEAKNKEQRKKINKELSKLKKSLAEIKLERKSTVAFEGGIYNTSEIQDFMLLTTDRISSAIRGIEDTVTRLALATAVWTYSIRKNSKGKKVVTKLHTLIKESQRALSDLTTEYQEIAKAIRQTRQETKKTNKRIRKETKSYNEKIAKAKKAMRNAEEKEEREAYQKEIKQLQKDKKADLEKLRTSLNNIDARRKELLNQKAENLAARYEAQAAVFDAAINRFEQRLTKIDTLVQIATIQNTDSEGELTDKGKSAVKGLYNRRGEVLQQERARIQKELRDARRTKDIERQRELEQALLDNQLAILENTQSINELDESVKDNTDVFSFKSTSWEVFRRAVTDGNGQIAPDWLGTIPQMASGGYIKSEGLVYAHAAEVILDAKKSSDYMNQQNGSSNSGPYVDTINFTQPLEVADPIAVSNQIGFKLSTMKSV